MAQTHFMVLFVYCQSFISLLIIYFSISFNIYQKKISKPPLIKGCLTEFFISGYERAIGLRFLPKVRLAGSFLFVLLLLASSVPFGL